MRRYLRAWRWGERPPGWVWRPVREALERMGRRRESVHAIDLTSSSDPEGFALVIGICHRRHLQRFLELMADALAGKIITPNMTDDWLPRKAVAGDVC